MIFYNAYLSHFTYLFPHRWTPRLPPTLTNNITNDTEMNIIVFFRPRLDVKVRCGRLTPKGETAGAEGLCPEFDGALTLYSLSRPPASSPKASVSPCRQRHRVTIRFAIFADRCKVISHCWFLQYKSLITFYTFNGIRSNQRRCHGLHWDEK